MKLTERAVDAVIGAHLEYIVGDSRVFWAVLDSCSEDDIRAWAKEHGYVLNRFFPGLHSTAPGQLGHAFACTCGWQGSQPCPLGPQPPNRARG